MKKKILSIFLLILTLMLLLMSLSVVSFGGAGLEWGFPAYFTLHYNKDIPNPKEWQTIFHHWNILLTFTALSIPVFIAGFIWGRPNKK